MSSTTTQYLRLASGDRIAYHTSAGEATVGILFCNGFRSEMTGRKAMAVEDYCASTRVSKI